MGEVAAMIETPQVLSETPGSVDLLSDLLGNMHLSGAVFLRADFREPWSIRTPDACQLARILTLRSEYTIPFHIIAQGGCRLEMEGSEPVRLNEGDAVLLPYGNAHTLSGRDPAATVPIGTLVPPPPWDDIQALQYGGEGAPTRLVCGFLQCDELLFHPVLRPLPALIQVSPTACPGDEWLASTIRHTAHEASHARAGTRCMLPLLIELMFVEILRKHMQILSADEVGWFAALNDPVAGAALKCLHAAPLEPWDVDGLARRVGVSRSVLAQRFRHFLGQPPMQYLTHWRLQLAAQALKTSSRPLKRIAEQAGYESEAAFSRAFKRHFGFPPAVWRERQRPAG
jgi:AraC family transcriptional regulator, alkane utilization regulator